MPWSDWQFWVVTLAAAGGLVLLARAVVPRKKKRSARTRLTISAGVDRSGGADQE